MTKKEENTNTPLQPSLDIAGVNNRTYFGKVCKWCKSTKTHYDYVTIEGGEVWQCDNCSQEFIGDY